MNPGASLPHHDNMPLNEPRVEHVTDTALMVAAARAMETVRADGVVRDLFAGRLAGAWRARAAKRWRGKWCRPSGWELVSACAAARSTRCC